MLLVLLPMNPDWQISISSIRHKHKKRGASLFARSTNQGSRIAQHIETSNAENPTWMYVKMTINNNNAIMANVQTSMGRPRCFVFDMLSRICEILICQETKRTRYAFYVYVSLHLVSKGLIVLKDNAKVRIIDLCAKHYIHFFEIGNDIIMYFV